MDLFLWILQGTLAALFGLDGYWKFFRPATFKVQGLENTALLLFIGASEMAGAVGLLLPWALRILPWLTSWAALGIAAIMVLAIHFHLQRREGLRTAFACCLLGTSLFVAVGRWATGPIS